MPSHPPPSALIRLSARNPMRVALLSVLIFEAMLFALAIPVMILVSGVPAGAAAGACGAAALLALASSATLRRSAGYPLGWLTQFAGIALGLLTPTMYVVGAIFAALWVVSFILGKRLDAVAPA